MPHATPEARAAYQRKWRLANMEKRTAYLHVWHKNNPEKEAMYSRAYRKANPTKRAVSNRAWLLRTRGLDPIDPITHWETVWKEQEYKCKICRATSPGSKSGWQADHDHATGKFRGILCHKCNATLGHAGDDLDRLRGCMEYLEKGGCIPCPDLS